MAKSQKTQKNFKALLLGFMGLAGAGVVILLCLSGWAFLQAHGRGNSAAAGKILIRNLTFMCRTALSIARQWMQRPELMSPLTKR